MECQPPKFDYKYGTSTPTQKNHGNLTYIFWIQQFNMWIFSTVFFWKTKAPKKLPPTSTFQSLPCRLFLFLIAISNKKHLQDFEQKEKDGTFFFLKGKLGEKQADFPSKLRGRVSIWRFLSRHFAWKSRSFKPEIVRWFLRYVVPSGRFGGWGRVQATYIMLTQASHIHNPLTIYLLLLCTDHGAILGRWIFLSNFEFFFPEIYSLDFTTEVLELNTFEDCKTSSNER